MFGDFVSSDIDFGKIEKWNEAYETYILLIHVINPTESEDMIESMNMYMQQNSDEINKLKQNAFSEFIQVLRTAEVGRAEWPDHTKVRIPQALWKSYKEYGDKLSEKWNRFIFKGSSPRPRNSISPVFDDAAAQTTLIDIFKLEKLNHVFKRAGKTLGNRGDTVIWEAYQKLFEGITDCVISGQRLRLPPVGLTSEALFGISGSDVSSQTEPKLVNNCAMIDGNHQFFRSPTLTNFKGTPNLFSLPLFQKWVSLTDLLISDKTPSICTRMKNTS